MNKETEKSQDMEPVNKVWETEGSRSTMWEKKDSTGEGRESPRGARNTEEIENQWAFPGLDRTVRWRAEAKPVGMTGMSGRNLKWSREMWGGFSMWDIKANRNYLVEIRENIDLSWV